MQQTYFNNLAPIDIITVISYLLICISIGVYHFKKIKTDKDFSTVIKSKTLPSILICTIFATAIGGGTIIGYVDELYNNPVVLFFIITQPFFWVVTSRIVTPGIEKFKDCTTLTQIMHNLFGKFGKNITLYAVIIDCIGAMTMQALAFGLIFKYFFGTDLYISITIGIAIINIYSMLGGLRGIIAIDILQFLISFLIIPISYVITITKIDLNGNFLDSITLPNYSLEGFTWPVLMGLLTASLMPELAAPFIQRYLMLADNKKALRTVFKRLFMITVPFMLSICLIAYLTVIRSKDNTLTSNVILYYIELLPYGIKGLMISGLFAILMSTADSYINATTIIISNDFIKPHFSNIGSKRLLLTMRGIILLLSSFPLILVFYYDTLFYLMSLLRSLGTNIIIVPLSIALLGYKVSNKQFLYSFLSSILFIIATTLLFNDDYPLLLTFSVILGGLIGAACEKNLWKNAAKIISTAYIWLYCLTTKLLQNIKRLKNINVAKITSSNEIKPTTLNNFSLFLFSYYFVFSLYLDNTKSLLPYLIIIGYGLVVILMLRDILFSEKLVKKYSNLYYCICLTFCLPLVSSYLLFHYTAPNNDSHIWVINSLLTTFLLYQFLSSIAFLISMTTGFILGCILYMIEIKNTNIGYSSYLVIYIYLSLLFISLIITREKEKKSLQKQKLQEEKFNMVQLFGEMIAHEIKTPVSITTMQSYLFKDILNDVKKNKAQEGFVMKMANYEAFKDTTATLIEANQYGLNIIDNLLISLRGAAHSKQKEIILVKDLIKKSIQEYKLYIPELKNIKLDIISNFKINYSFNILKHVLINLIKNAYIHNGLNIRIELFTKDNTLYFKDYGKGIEAEIVEKIFDKFFTQSKNGIGIGLSFCKLIMADVGGSIKCESMPGKYTTFILKFPKIINKA